MTVTNRRGFMNRAGQLAAAATIAASYRTEPRSAEANTRSAGEQPVVQEGHENGNAFYGTEGVLILGKQNGWQLFGPKNKLIEEGFGSPDLAAHHRDFLECVRESRLPHADIGINHFSSSLCHLGNIATRVGRVLEFDSAEEELFHDDEAGRLLRRDYRAGHWAAPVGA